MSQYYPALPQEDGNLNRFLTKDEFDKVYSHALDLGFEHLFVQFPDKAPFERIEPSLFLPDFRRSAPFAGNNP